MKKNIFVILVLVLAALMLAACAQDNAKPDTSAEWTIAVEGAEKDAFTSVDYAALDMVKVDAVLKTKDGSETNQSWEGVLLKDVLAALGVKDYSSVTMEASDGYAKDYTPDMVNDQNTILGTVLDGESLGEQDGFVQAVAGSHPGNMWIKSLVKIKVNA